MQPVKCPFCKTDFSGDFTQGQVRCPDCGKLIDQELAASSAGQSALDYRTPYGYWTLQPQEGGEWNAVYHFDVDDATGERIKTLVVNLAKSVNKTTSKRFAQLTGYKEKNKSCVWKLPSIVVRGFRQADDVTFEDAWVSPTGTIIAITRNKLYQLK